MARQRPPATLRPVTTVDDGVSRTCRPAAADPQRSRTLKRSIRVLALAVAASLAALLAVTASASTARPQKVEHVSLTVVPGGKKGPDGRKHDAYLGRTTIDATVGEKVVVTVKNTDGGLHSFTSPSLGLSQVFAGNKTTTFSFTAKKAGKYEWHCVMPCDSEAGAWAMTNVHRDGYMGGYVIVTG